MNQAVPARYQFRQADWPDAIRIQRLLNGECLFHRYLDWRDPLAWLGKQPFLILEENGELRAVMAAPADPPGISWIRLFACSWDISLTLAWQTLLERSKAQLLASSQPARCFILALEDWMDALLRQMGYHKHQEIIVLHRNLADLPKKAFPNGGLSIREMVAGDLDSISEIDAASFEQLWVYSAETLKLAFEQSTIHLIAEVESHPVGYLMATISGNAAHLARVAVKPEATRHHIASCLIQQMLESLSILAMPGVTLNTQSDNKASLALYDTMGFRKTGEVFNVYQIL